MRGLALDGGFAHTDSGPRTLVNLEAAGGTPGGETPQNEIIDCWRCSSTFTVSCRSLWQRCIHCWFRHFWFELVMRASSSSGLVQLWFRFGSALVQVWFISGPSPEVLLRGESESLIPQDVLVRCMSKHFAAEDHADTLSSKFNLARRRLFAQTTPSLPLRPPLWATPLKHLLLGGTSST